MIYAGSRELGLEMGETELEEGEAPCSRDEEEDSTIDPDIAFSYIGDKLQNILGHFQKDFEGGVVSAENLGAKFGGYGSFLPTYQRSPTWSHTRNPPPEVHNYDKPNTPIKMHSEDQRKNLLASSGASPSAKKLCDSLGKNVVKKSVNPSDQRTLKVRIKVGSENLPTQKNAEIYSGLGLVVSPSSSLDDSPDAGERLHDYSMDESPNSILQVMTSLSVSRPLSPLSDDLLHLAEKRKVRGNSGSKFTEKTSKERSGVLMNGSVSSRSNNQKVLEQKKLKSSEKDETFFIGGDQNSSDSLLHKEKDMDSLDCDELVSNALKLPLLSNSQHTFVNPSKGVEGDTFSEVIEKENSDKVSEIKKGNVLKTENFNVPDQFESNVSVGRKAPSLESIDPSKQSIEGSKSSLEKSSLEKSSSGGKRKLKGVAPKDRIMVEPSTAPKSGKTNQSNISKNDSPYREFFGEMEFGEDDKESISGEMSSSGRLKHHQSKRSTSEYNNNTNVSDKKCRFGPGSNAGPTPPLVSGPDSEAPPPLVEEDWVQCDKCKKWRLLPLGTDPKSLPKIWLCRMLTWLPGMNRCSIPEDQTTIALTAVYDPAASFPAPSSIGTQHNQLINNSIGTSDAKFAGQENQDTAFLKINGKRKHGSTDLEGRTHSLNSLKNVPESGNNSNFKRRSRSPNLDAEKDKKVSLVNSSDTGTNSKIRSKRESEAEGSRGPKKVKGEDLPQFDDEKWTSDNGEASLKTKALSNNAPFNKDSKGETKKKNTVSGPNQEMHVPDCKDSARKRKGKEISSSQYQSNPIFNSDQCQQKAGDFVEEMCESEHRKEKKARVTKEGTNGQYPSNSSSSKVSGSRKKKTSAAQELKDSPVESVSSSPLRFCNTDKVSTSTRRSLDGKYDSHDSCDKNGANNHEKFAPGKCHNEEKTKPEHSQIEKDIIIKASDSSNGYGNLHEEKLKSKRNKSGEKSGTLGKVEKSISKKEVAVGTTLHESSKGQDVVKKQDKKHRFEQENDEKLRKRSDQVEVNGNGKSHSLPPLARVQMEAKENGVKVSTIDNGDALKLGNQVKESEKQNGQVSSRNPTPNSRKTREVESASPVRRDSSSHAANNALKEAKDLKHLADRLKNSGSTESIGYYFQAALKFLHGASLLESGSSENSKQNEVMHAMHIYSSTAKLCEFCAHEYEKSKDMAAAALAYKCVEVAYMRVVYSSHSSAGRDRNELQIALQIAPPGESPSSSASDVDNLNQSNPDKAASLTKVVDSPQVSTSHVISSRNRAGFMRLLNFAQDVNFAMEASRKSRIAFTAASSRLGETPHKDSISSLKKALDLNYQDVESLLRLVRVAMEAINR